MKQLVTGAVLAVTMAAGTAFGHEGHAHKIMGVVTALGTDRIEVRTRGGEMLSIGLTPQTTVRAEKRKTTPDQGHVGRRVVVNIGSGEDPLVARDIQVGVMDPSVTSRP